MIKTTVFVFLLVMFSVPVAAQRLDSASAPRNAKEYLKSVEAEKRKELDGTESENNNKEAEKTAPAADASAKKSGTKQAQQPIKIKAVDGKLKIENMPDIKTTDGSKRGNATFLRIPKKNEKEPKNEDMQLIFLYYDNFKITRSLSGGIGCDVKFAVMTNLDQRLTNLSVKLKWPGMTTSLSFNNVNPNIETYYNYALFGEGCYTMDKIPNIIVNRCRVKGMSQEKCASKIRWLSRK